MKVVLDTNLLASGFVNFAHPTTLSSAVLQAWRAELFELVVSEYILAELERTLQKPYFQARMSEQDRLAALALLRKLATLTAISIEVSGAASQAKDDPIIATALSAEADFLVTDDRAFRDKVGPRFRHLAVVGLPEFARLLSATGRSGQS